MNSSGISRKDFLGGVLASMGFGALAGRPIFAVAGGTDFGTPNLVFGVVADTHMQSDGNRKGGFWKNKDKPQAWYQDGPFWKALQYFKQNKVDAVMHCGDLADCGRWREIEFHADVWDEVFGHDSIIDRGTPDEKKVEKLFVLGNHDEYEKKERKPDDIVFDYLFKASGKGGWRDIWGEDYSHSWHKVIKGYHFFGCLYYYDQMGVYGPQMVNLIQRTRNDPTYAKYDANFGSKPFFSVVHAPLSDGHCNQMAACGNGICFHGHGHYNLTDKNGVFSLHGNGKIVSVLGGMMKRNYGGLVNNPGFAKGWGNGIAQGDGDTAFEMDHGWLVKVYDDKVVLHPVDFTCIFNSDRNRRTVKDADHVYADHDFAPLGPDYVVSLENWNDASAAHPCSYANRVHAEEMAGPPQFREGAKLSARFDANAARLYIPLADANVTLNADGTMTGTRAVGYNVEVSASGGTYRSSVWGKDNFVGVGQEANEGETVFSIPYDELPSGGHVTFRVWPRSSLGSRGAPIEGTFERSIVVSLEKTVPNVNRNARFVLTNGANLPPDTKLSVDPVPWVDRVVVEDGEIVAYTRPVGSTVGVK
ncbi:MAG: metallophosphoesterase [Kiritimatiellae bacterium]|nr:metallophosphoesterase [Kiritimatiellia bacterium]